MNTLSSSSSLSSSRLCIVLLCPLSTLTSSLMSSTVGLWLLDCAVAVLHPQGGTHHIHHPHLRPLAGGFYLQLEQVMMARNYYWHCQSVGLSTPFWGLLLWSGCLSCASLNFHIAPPGLPWPFWSFSTSICQEGQIAWVERKMDVCHVVCNFFLKIDSCKVHGYDCNTPAESKPLSGMGWVQVWHGSLNPNPHPNPHSTQTYNLRGLLKPMPFPTYVQSAHQTINLPWSQENTNTNTHPTPFKQ